MLRIVGIQRHFDPQREFILLQNQSGLKANLMRHIVTDDVTFEGAPERMYVFGKDEPIPASCYVILITGRGEDGWRRSKDGSAVFYVYWNRPESVWEHAAEGIHLLSVVHSKRPTGEPLSMTR